MKIAIIGTGISGLAAAYILNHDHDITVFEKNDYIGGHSRTIDVVTDAKKQPVDTGFIVFNKRNYPLLTTLFEHLDVPIVKSDMSFGASIRNGWLEYGSKGMFSQKKNLFRPKFWKMVFDILKFNRVADRHYEIYKEMTLADYLYYLKMGDWFRNYYLQAMGAAIWSCSVETILSFPASSFIQFFKNHGLLSVNEHPQWYTVKGGSREYVTRLVHSFRSKIKLGCGVSSVTRDNGKVQIIDEYLQKYEFDQVVFASHADETLRMLVDATEDEKSILGRFQYQPNQVVVHQDISFLPRNKGAWASWVYLSEEMSDHKTVVSLSYWMNNLQPISTDEPLIITLNPEREPQADKILNRHEFSHPVFTRDAIKSQQEMDIIQGVHNTWFCGAYLRYGFHEDGLLSAVNVTDKMGVKKPW